MTPLQVKISLQNPPELKVNECSTCATPQCLYPEEPIVLTLKIQALKVGKYLPMNTNGSIILHCHFYFKELVLVRDVQILSFYISLKFCKNVIFVNVSILGFRWLLRLRKASFNYPGPIVVPNFNYLGPIVVPRLAALFGFILDKH